MTPYNPWAKKTKLEKAWIRVRDLFVYTLNPVFQYRTRKAYKELMSKARTIRFSKNAASGKNQGQ